MRRLAEGYLPIVYTSFHKTEVPKLYVTNTLPIENSLKDQPIFTGLSAEVPLVIVPGLPNFAALKTKVSSYTENLKMLLQLTRGLLHLLSQSAGLSLVSLRCVTRNVLKSRLDGSDT